jgi:preprotein translocase subunit YajC
MPVPLSSTHFLMQPEPTGSSTASSGSAPSAPRAPDGPATMLQPMLMMALFFGVFYFLMIRPQQKKQRELDDLLKALKKGDVVRTTGGIRGEIVDLNDSDVTLLIADKVKINVLRSHIGGIAGVAAKDKA